MDYTRLGTTGLGISRICFGCMSYGDPDWRDWILDEAAARPFFERAIEAGINFFDTADMYSNGVSEEITGRALKALAKREDVVIATKVFFPMGSGPNDRGLSKKHIMAALDASLIRLGTDYVDLYQIHRFDPATPIEETLEALDACVRAGKVRYLGASSMYAWQFASMLAASDANGWSRFVSMQNHHNLIYREEEREMLPLCRAEGIGTLPWSPLARGMLAGNRSREVPQPTTRAKSDDYSKRMYDQDCDWDVVDALLEVAKERGTPPAQVALAWLMAKDGVAAPIIGATKLPHLEDAIAAIDVTLTDDEIERLESPYRPHTVRGHV